jgi:small-conductance mechanosensitive channel
MEPQTQEIVAENARQSAQELAAQVPFFFQPQWALVLLVGALLLSVSISRLAKFPGLRRVRHWLLLTRVLVWAVVIFNIVFALSRLVTAEYWLLLGVLVLSLISVSALDWLRNVVAGLALEFEGSFKPGDVVRYANVEGELADFGTRTVTMRADDGTLHQVPNQKFTRESVTHLELNGEAACVITIAIPIGVSPERAVNLAQQAAFLTPLASPHHRPDVFLDVPTTKGDALELRIRGYAFDPSYRAHFRSDVVARVHDLLRNERAVTGK